ncbi:MAG: response regulator [Lachnospiraceae bacterium]|nr:response regulator [Lachnospiraceae bacterium]
MYSAVIVDDERKVCNLILELGDWQRFGIEVAQVCTDGEEALEAICRLQPDIVLTDVRMPVYDGLELIRLVSEKGLHPAFIILSGYKYFEYAYSAFKYGVIDYLLKPIDGEQLNEVLDKTCQILGRQKRYARAEDEIRRLNEHVEQSNRRNMFLHLFDRGETFPRTAEELKKTYQKSFPKEALRVFFVRTNRDLEDDNSVLLVQKLEGTIRRVLKGDIEAKWPDSPVRVCTGTVHGGLAVILNFPVEETEWIKSLLQTILFDMIDVAEVFGNSQVSVGLSPMVTELKELPGLARMAEQAEAAKVVLGANRVLELSAYRFSRLTLEQVFTESERKSLKKAVETLSVGAMNSWLDRLEAAVDKRPPLRPEVILGLRDEIGGELEAYARLHREENFEEFRQSYLRETAQAAGLPAFFHCLRDVITRQMEIWRKARESEEKLPIRLAKAYLAEHYGEAVTLEQTAEQVGLSPAYFSTQFRQMEGRTFSDYLTSVRMEAARELLATTTMTNYEIASRIGYADEKYFGKVFKKEVGIRPGEYRKLYYRG